MEKQIILSKEHIKAALERIAGEIIERHSDMSHVVLIGIRTGGAFLAQRLQALIEGLTGTEVPTGILDITLYRDDWTRISAAPMVGKTEISFSIDDRIIILVDDVLFTGRTIRAAMDALMDFGRPRRIELASLVDRGNSFRELPIQADYSGGVWEVSSTETINVYLSEGRYDDHVSIEEKKVTE